MTNGEQCSDRSIIDSRVIADNSHNAADENWAEIQNGGHELEV